MNKKKITTLLVAAVLTLGVVGGTFAWFTSTDTATNKFGTQGNSSVTDKDKDGIEIYEDFDQDKANEAQPGVDVNKDVHVKNSATYDQFVRVKLVPKWTELPFETLSEGETSKLGKPFGIVTNCVNFTQDLTDLSNIEPGTWYKHGEYYYYMGVLPAGQFTSMLLDSVTLDGNLIGNEFKNSKYEVDVIAESVQALEDAVKSTWFDEDNSIVLNKLAQMLEGDSNKVGLESIGDSFKHITSN